MARKQSEKKLAEVHETSMRLLQLSQSSSWQERQQALSDRRFLIVDGAMWEDLAQQFENRPKMQVNKLMASFDKLMAEMKRSPVSVKYVAKDGAQSNEHAGIVTSLYRADEQDSFAQEAYENASSDAASGGFGAFRIYNAYEDEIEESGPQRIRFEPVVDADASVFFDLGAKRKDKSDARHCWVIMSLPIDQFKEDYPDRAIASLYQNVHGWEFDWFTPQVVRIAEHYVVDKTTVEIQTWQHISGEEKEIDAEEFVEGPEYQTQLEEEGWALIETKKRKQRVVRKYIEDGNGVIEDCGIIAGKYIPVIPMYGKRFFVDNVERYQGVVRLAKDAQRILNMVTSRIVELATATGWDTPIFAPEQVAKFRTMWEEHNVKNFPYLLAEPLRNPDGTYAAMGPIATKQAPQLPPALAAAYAQVQTDIADIMSMKAQDMSVQSNISGEAVKLIIDQLSLYALGYMQNRADAIKHAGVVYLSMAKEVYNEKGRKMKAVAADGTVSSIELGKVINKNGVNYDTSLENASFDVVATTEPALISKKAELTRSLTGLLQYTQDPQISGVLQLEIIKNAEGSELSGIQEWARKQLVERGVEPGTPEEMQALAAKQGQPNAQDQALQAYAAKQAADAELAKANIGKVNSEIQKNLATVQQIMADIESGKLGDAHATRAQLLAELQGLSQMMQSQAQMTQIPAAESGQAPMTQGFGDQIGRGAGKPHL